MKKLVLIAALASALAAPAFAQAPDASRMIERLREADANNDGVVSRAEFASHRASQFTRFDRNGDGYLTDDDIPRFAARRGGAMNPETMIEQFDSNSDGRVSQSEFANGPTPAFDRVDSNGDDRATEAEFTAALETARSAR